MVKEKDESTPKGFRRLNLLLSDDTHYELKMEVAKRGKGANMSNVIEDILMEFWEMRDIMRMPVPVIKRRGFMKMYKERERKKEEKQKLAEEGL